MLFGLLVFWGFFMRPRPQPSSGASVREEAMAPPGEAETDTGETREQEDAGFRSPADDAGAEKDIAPEKDVDLESEKAPVKEQAGEGHSEKEKIITLRNEEMDVEITSWGGAVSAVRLKKYRAQVDSSDEKLLLDFSTSPSLSIRGVPGLSTNNDFEVVQDRSGSSAFVSRKTAGGLEFSRSIELTGDYLIRVRDRYVNNSGEDLSIGPHGVCIGPMEMVRTKASQRGYSYLDVDTLADQGSARVRRWSKEFPELFGSGGGFLSCARRDPGLLPEKVSAKTGVPIAWTAVKNKFFVEILSMPGDQAPDDCEVIAERDSHARSLTVSRVSANAVFNGERLAPGESIEREFEYYAGPKKYAVLSKLDKHRDKVMLHAWKHWGWFRSVCVLLLKTLNAIHFVIPNYGVAIILLTVIVRVIFWPITHKGTENMKRMQTIQPMVSELREKYKDNPQKMQKETMALYKEHKVNPMMGCLPMLVQIPVFIALFTVLRSAVELRFADFLWIRDLSEPERIFEFGFAIPIIGWDALNILPIIMTGTMVWQQKLTPTAGDPQQQKMMAVMMPAMMLFLLYNMASALMLYWSVSQLLAIVQLIVQRKKTEAEENAGS